LRYVAVFEEEVIVGVLASVVTIVALVRVVVGRLVVRRVSGFFVFFVFFFCPVSFGRSGSLFLWFLSCAW